MNNTRWLLLVPLLISVLCVAGSVFVRMKFNTAHPEMLRPESSLRWHQQQMKSDDPQILKRHSEKLWQELVDTDERSVETFQAVAASVVSVIWVSSANLVFCTAAFLAARNKKSPIP